MAKNQPFSVLRRIVTPPKMKVKWYMYPQMKKPVGMLIVACCINAFFAPVIVMFQF
jgi:hypothetical protein